MSFKRDGENPSLFQNIQKRQVNDLLSQDIPQDEARLERNGKYLCLVCAHKPIIDTIAMLVLHRKGRKHLQWKESFDERKRELSDLKQKRIHEQYVNQGTVATSFPCDQHATKYSNLLNAPAYNPRSKKPKKRQKPYGRRQILDLEDDIDVGNFKSSQMSARRPDSQQHTVGSSECKTSSTSST